MSYWNDTLSHFGITGQKWGVRRYQNEDGSLTEEGRARYNVGDEKSSGVVTRMALATIYQQRNEKNVRSKVEELKLNSKKNTRVTENDIRFLSHLTRKNRNSILEEMKKDTNLTFDQALKNANKRAAKKALMLMAAISATTLAVASAPQIRNSVLRNKAVQQLIKRAKYRKMNAIVLKKNEWSIDMPKFLTGK